jgi:FkbM family methyltransferase
MEKTFTTQYGTFTLDSSRDAKMVQAFERTGFHQREDIELILKYTDSNSTVLDIGAHVGTMTIPIAKKARHVHAFEPVNKTRDFLLKNINQNTIDNVTIYPFALGNEEGRVSMVSRSASNAGAYTVGGGTDIPMHPLDSLLEHADVIKIDVEGFEPQVFEGARELIKSAQPVIFFEVNLPELRKHGNSPLKRIERALRGYTFYVGGKKVSRLWHAALELEPKFFLIGKGSGITFNVLALPKGTQRL